MASPTEKLPKFERPPVVEVALSAQFQPLAKFTVAHLGLLWKRFSSRFPNVEQQPPIPHFVERTGVRVQAPQVQFEMLRSGDLTPRLWMLNEVGTELIQVQADRFIRNWRKHQDPTATYPQYEKHLRPQFEQDYLSFQRFVSEEGLGELVVDQCEVTYINHISRDGVWTDHSQLDRVFIGWSGSYANVVGLPAEHVAVRAAHVLSHDASDFVGRLHVQVDSGFKPSPVSGDTSTEPVFNLQLVARGRPLGEGTQGVLSFLDAGHRAIVTTFANMTTPAMHNAWKRYQ